MKKTAKNSLLVMVLGGLLGMPLLGFGFIEYGEPVLSDVLGVQDVPRVSHVRTNKEIQLVDQIELKLNLNNNQKQKFYNILPEEYLDESYQVIIVIPNEYQKLGITTQIEKNELTRDLLIDLQNFAEKLDSISLTLLVLR